MKERFSTHRRASILACGLALLAGGLVPETSEAGGRVSWSARCQEAANRYSHRVHQAMSVRADYCARRYGVPVRTTRVYVGTPWYDGYVPAYSLELGRSRSYSRPTYSVNATRELIGEPAPRFGYGAETSRTEHTRHEPSEPEKSTPRIVTDESGTLMEEVSPANRPESVRLEKPAPEKKASVKADEKKTADQAGKKVAKKTVEDKSFPLARPSDRAGYVYSPHAPHNLIDATGFKPGDKAIDPTTGKPFMVP